MTLKPSYILAGVAVIAIAAWFAFNSELGSDDIYADLEARDAQTEAALPTVVVRRVIAEPHTIRLSAYGRTSANRMVEVKAKTAASVIATPVAEGRYVTKGTEICRQDTDARQALVDQAKAQLDKAEADFRATTTLVEKGFRSSAQLAGERAAVDAARAQLKQAEIELSNIILRAPFDGIYEKRLAEVGDYLAPGQPCAMIVELDPLKVETELTETQVGSVSRGQDVDVRLATGELVTGKVATIETVANPATRTFRMETRLENPRRTLKAGVSATVSFATGEAMASLVPSGVLTLDEDGLTGVRYVDTADRVQFVRVTQIDETPAGLWVTGLPENVRLIIEGQDYVSVGTKVDPRVESARNGSDPIARSSARADLN